MQRTCLGLITMDNGCLVQVDYAVATQSLPSWFVQGDRGTIVVQGTNLRIHASEPAAPSDPTQFYDEAGKGKCH